MQLMDMPETTRKTMQTTPGLLSRLVSLALLAGLLASCAAPRQLERPELVSKGRDYLASTASAATGLPDNWTLEAAVQRALVAHVDYRVSLLEQALATGNRKLATMDMLPQVVAQAGYQRRDTAEASTSTDRETSDSHLYLGWDMLDFAVAYLRRRELASQELAAAENRRRVAQLTVLDVAHAWHQVQVWQTLTPELDALREEVSEALRQSDEIMRLRLGDTMQAVEYRSALLLVLRRIDAVNLQLDQARDRLAQLLHLPPGHVPQVDATGMPLPSGIAGLDASRRDLWQAAAFVHRPEFRQALYDSRAQNTGAVRRLVEMLPRAVFRTGTYRDNNSFLANQEWEQSSAQLSFDIMRLASLPGLRHNLRLSRELSDLREQAVSSAVMSQVSMSIKAYERRLNSWCLNSNLLEVDRQRSALLDARSRVAAIDNLSRLRARLDSLLLRTEAGLELAELHRARMMLLHSAGLLDVPEEADDATMSEFLGTLLGGPLGSAVGDELRQVAGDFELPPPAADVANTRGDEVCEP